MIRPLARVIFWFVVLAISLGSCVALAQVVDFEMNKEYDGMTVACKEKEDVYKFLSAESPAAFAQEQGNSCFIGYTKFVMEKILETKQVKKQMVNIVSGKVFGGYLQAGDTLVYTPFDKPDAVYFVVATKKGVRIT